MCNILLEKTPGVDDALFFNGKLQNPAGDIAQTGKSVRVRFGQESETEKGNTYMREGILKIR